MPLSATNFVTKGPVLHADMLQFFNLFTGVMLDQPVTFKNTLTLGGNQGSSTVPLKIYGAVGQTSHLLDLYADTGQAQPGFGFGASGNFAWGPGGASPQDTFLSRVATQNGHASDTAGLLVQPYLEVAGNISAQTYLFTNQATISGPGPNPFQLAINQDLVVNRYASFGSASVGPLPATGAVINIAPTAGLSPTNAIVVSGTYISAGANSAVAGLNIQAAIQAAAANATIYGEYQVVQILNPGGYTGLTAVGKQLLWNGTAPAGFTNSILMSIGDPQGAAHNWALSVGGKAIIARGLQIGATGQEENMSAALHVSPANNLDGTTTPQGIYLTGAFTGSAASSAAGINMLGSPSAHAANDVLYGIYLAPQFQPGGFATVQAQDLAIIPFVGGNVYNHYGVHIGQVSGGTNVNYSLVIDAPSGANAYAIVVGGGGISFPANVLSGNSLQDATVTGAKLANQAAMYVTNIISAPGGAGAQAAWGPTPDPFGSTGVVLNIGNGDWVDIHMTVSVVSTVAGNMVYIAAGRDGALWQNLGTLYCPLASTSHTATFHLCASDTAGSHRYTLWWAMANGAANTITLSTGVYTVFSIKQLRRPQ